MGEVMGEVMEEDMGGAEEVGNIEGGVVSSLALAFGVLAA